MQWLVSKPLKVDRISPIFSWNDFLDNDKDDDEVI